MLTSKADLAKKIGLSALLGFKSCPLVCGIATKATALLEVLQPGLELCAASAVTKAKAMCCKFGSSIASGAPAIVWCCA